MKSLITIIASVFILGWIFNIFNQKWTGFYYPNEGDLITHVKSSELNSIDACREWVNGMANKYNPDGYGYDYECGKNCKLSETGSGLFICDETIE
jgi:hypothetical protein